MIKVKDFERRSLFWIIQVGPKSNGKCLCKKEAEGDLTDTEEKKQRQGAGNDHGCRNWSYVAISQGAVKIASKCQKPEGLRNPGSLGREYGPDDIFVSDLRPSELRGLSSTVLSQPI